MLEPICNSSPVDAIKYGDDQDISCLPRATAFLFVYNLPWLPYLLGLCSYALFQESSTEKRSKCRVFVEEGLLNQPMVGTYIGLLVGLVSPLRDLFFDSDAELLFVASTSRIVAGPMLGVLSLLVGSSLGTTCRRLWLSWRPKEQVLADGATMGDQANQPNKLQTVELGELAPAGMPHKSELDGQQSTDACDTGTPPSKGHSMDEVLNLDSSSMGNPAAAQSNLSASCEEEQAAGTVEQSDTGTELADVVLTNWQLTVLVVSKMVLMPAATVPMVIFLSDFTIPSSLSIDDKNLVKLILVIESAAPSADTIMGICMQYGRTHVCEMLSRMYFIQYLVSILSLTSCVCIGYAWVF